MTPFFMLLLAEILTDLLAPNSVQNSFAPNKIEMWGFWRDGGFPLFVDASSIYKLGVDVVILVFALIDWHPEASFEVISHLLGPIFESHVFSFDFKGRSGDNAIVREFSEPRKDGELHSNEFNRSTISWSGRNTSIARDIRTAHLIHPGSAIVFVSSETESSLVVTADLDVESSVLHAGVDLRASIPLSKLDTICMAFANLNDEVQYAQSSSVTLFEVLSLVIVLEVEFEFLVEELIALFRDDAVVLNGLEEEPRSISAIESGVVAAIVKVG